MANLLVGDKLFTTIAVLILAVQQSHETGATIKKSAWQQMCALAANLNKIPGLAKQQIIAAEQTATAEEEMAQRAELLGLVTEDNATATVAFALSALLYNKARARRRSIPATAKAGLTATGTGQRVVGGINEFLTILSTGSSNHAAGCLNNHDSDGQQVVRQQSELTGCDFAVPTFAEDGQPQELDAQITANGFAALKAADVKEAGAGNNKCAVFQATDADDATTSKVFHKQAELNLAGGTLKLGPTTPTMNTVDGENLNQGGGTQRATLLQAAHTDAKAVKANGIEPKAADAESTAETAIRGGELKAKLIELQQLLGGAEEATGTGDRAQETIDQVFGPKGASFKAKWASLMETMVRNPSKKTGEKIQMKKVPAGPELQKLLLFEQAAQKFRQQQAFDDLKRQQANKKQQKTATDSEKTEEKCKDKPQAECKDEDGCEFKEEKCQAKVTTKTEKTTNTTGSNSLLIKTSPLWLAFLILA
uniref:Variant surface glycoprotein 639 n=1 Tax=Trypanosoma brucei TaxID=5691 RepID=M4TDP9_9TRYP|nr:variant surface glycoprotein 639 [Trypanosoma brucei]